MRYGMEVRARASDLFEQGFAERAVSTVLGVRECTVKKWLYTYRALGKEALLVSAHLKYDYETKLAAARDVVDGGLSKPEVMERYGIKSISPLKKWCASYASGDLEALRPKPKGRPAKPEKPIYASREEELEARIRELELENAILKRINALAEEIEQRRRLR